MLAAFCPLCTPASALSHVFYAVHFITLTASGKLQTVIADCLVKAYTIQQQRKWWITEWQ